MLLCVFFSYYYFIIIITITGMHIVFVFFLYVPFRFAISHWSVLRFPLNCLRAFRTSRDGPSSSSFDFLFSHAFHHEPSTYALFFVLSSLILGLFFFFFLRSLCVSVCPLLIADRRTVSFITSSFFPSLLRFCFYISPTTNLLNNRVRATASLFSNAKKMHG
jgi:hypothetical protein